MCLGHLTEELDLEREVLDVCCIPRYLSKRLLSADVVRSDVPPLCAEPPCTKYLRKEEMYQYKYINIS